MSTRTGRPKSDNPKATQVTARLDNETIHKLEACMQALSTTKAEVIRLGIEKVYSGIKK